MAFLKATDFDFQLYPEVRTAISRDNSSIVNEIIEMAEGEAMAYLNRFDTTTMFGGSFNDALLKGMLLDIAVWRLVKIANPNINMDLAKAGYDEAISFFNKVMKGNVEPKGWPLKSTNENGFDEGGHIAHSSNEKRGNHY